MPKSKASFLLYAISALVAAFAIYGVIVAFHYSDHPGHIWEAIDRELPQLALAGFVLGAGLSVQYLSDIRWILMNRDQSDA